MKKVILVSLCFFLTNLIFAGKAGNAGNKSTTDTLLYIPGAPELLDEIINAAGLQPNFELRQADVMNIEASISHRKRYILYNPAYIAQINQLTGDKWAALALLAHEVGHHLNGHTIKKRGSNPKDELEADEFAGFILQKLGATLAQSQEVMKYIATMEGSSTHPGRISRMLAIAKGWNKAGHPKEIAATIKASSPAF